MTRVKILAEPAAGSAGAAVGHEYDAEPGAIPLPGDAVLLPALSGVVTRRLLHLDERGELVVVAYVRVIGEGQDPR